MAHRDIIVVGASAGGIPALESLVAGLPATLPAAVLVVLHLSPHIPSYLDAILARAGALSVTPAIDGEPIVPGRVYVALTDRHLMLEEGRLRVTHGPKENRVRPAIDVLFRSAAYAFGPRVIGVVLSGLLDDGTAGAWAIKDRGGVVLVQSPEEAKHASMPESVLRHVDVDYTLPVAHMPRVIAQLINKPIIDIGDAVIADTPRIENRVTLEARVRPGEIMQLGSISPNTCPECKGVLTKIEEGPITRYRCHTGHAYSLQTLMADVNEEVEMALWSAVRVANERMLLLGEMEKMARARGDEATAQQCAEQVQTTKSHLKHIQEAALDHKMFDHL
ncbi:chemotaxis protein CheB [Methylobacter sp. BlB1]|uniref:chemotaxis protein CheB n=1 Tax=Methylobacter sp. BlB1 TaxID=2785914 RepID=UPI0018946D6A|nr:chemotaxis protein CheB [Methylobacter sp. BlB1]MBF6648704.1 chemotaxis protein CheB [Methylobacter sp. BlB1]